MSDLVELPGSALIATGAETVGLVEDFYLRAFTGVLAFLAPSSAAALALLPLRKSVNRVDARTPTLWLAVLLVIAAPFAARRGAALYARLRRRHALELLPV